jgi:ribosomal protein S18 acetylase RimI-like enzyme
MLLAGYTARRIPDIQRLNTASLPMHYGEKFYASIDPSLSAVAVRVGASPPHVVGAICSKVEQGSLAYIMSLTVCPKERTKGVGSSLVADMIRKSNNNFQLTAICLHVQTNNEDAINLYERFGFAIIETIPGFYQQNLDYDIAYHADCHVMRKTLLPWPKRRCGDETLAGGG